MAGMFYSLKEVAEKLGKSEDEVRSLVKSGNLREFRDGPNLLFKIDEVNSLMSDTGVMPSASESEELVEIQPEAEGDTEAVAAEEQLEPLTPAEPEAKDEEELEPLAPVEPEAKAEEELEPLAPIEPEVEETVEISDISEGDTGTVAAEKELEPAAPVEPKAEEKAEDEILLAPDLLDTPDKEIELSDADTAIVEEGIKVLGETDTAGALDESGPATFEGLDETAVSPSKEASLEEIEKDVSLDTFGSGSGLLDLSLQADDTSLGGILDEIYTPEGEGKITPSAQPAQDSAMEVAAEADEMLSEVQFPEPQVTAPMMAAQAYAEPEPDAMSNAMGLMLFLPLLAVIYTALVAVAGFRSVMPGIMLKGVMIWYVAAGLAVASTVILAVGATMGGEKKPKAPKVKKVKLPKVKKVKAKKAKKGT